jgi:hypothetical protein
MDSQSASSDSTVRRRKRRKSKTLRSRIAQVWRNWWVEIVIVILLLLAVFLLVERMNIRQTLFAALLSLVEGLSSGISRFFQNLVGFVQRTTVSDLTAYGLLAVVVGLLAWRTRQRVLNNPALGGTTCPNCGSELHRSHRHGLDRAVNIFVPVRRYRCRNRECGWYGLRVHKHD